MSWPSSLASMNDNSDFFDITSDTASTLAAYVWPSPAIPSLSNAIDSRPLSRSSEVASSMRHSATPSDEVKGHKITRQRSIRPSLGPNKKRKSEIAFVPDILPGLSHYPVSQLSASSSRSDIRGPTRGKFSKTTGTTFSKPPVEQAPSVQRLPTRFDPPSFDLNSPIWFGDCVECRIKPCCCPNFGLPLYDSGQQRSTTTAINPSQQRNDAGPQPTSPKKMEGSGTTVMSLPAPPGGLGSVTMSFTDNTNDPPLDLPLSPMRLDQAPIFQRCHVRSGAEALGSADAADMSALLELSAPSFEESSGASQPVFTNTGEPASGEKLPDNEHQPKTPDSTSAFARLSFVDSYFLIRTPNVIIGRDEIQADELRTTKRRDKSERQARQVLEEYSREPSQPSQRGDLELDEDDTPDSLRGNIMSGPASNFSGHGGPISFESQDAPPTAQRRSRKPPLASSSTNSIAPQDLQFTEVQARSMVNKDGSVINPEEWAKLPVHTADAGDIMKISREHLWIFYEVLDECWHVKVIGNNAFVNGELYRKDGEVTLHHGDEIYIATIGMKFELPSIVANNGVKEESMDDSDSNSEMRAGTPDSTGAEASDEDDANGRSEGKKKRKPATSTNHKIKLKLSGKRAANGDSIDSPEAPQKGDGSQKATAVAATAVASEFTDTVQEGHVSPNAQPPESQVYSHVDAQFRPEKRKGPGRPPKNGLLSKRDDNALKKRIKELEKQGKSVGPDDYNALLQQVRQEQRLKDAQSKAQATGQPMPDIPVPSIEGDFKINTGQDGSLPEPDSKAQGLGSPTIVQRPSSPKATRQLSPVPPRSNFTEEELKKPTQTYPYLLDEILDRIEELDLQGDLPTIYDQMMKRWPWFKYEAPSQGWQSSIRHNLQQDPRFIDAGKAGKGKLWKIDRSVPRERKKQTRPPAPPQNAQIQQGYNAMQQNPYGQQYNATYGQQAVPGQAPRNGAPQPHYSSPYGTYGQPQAGPVAQTPNGVPLAGQQQAARPPPPRSNTHSRPTSQQPQQQPPTPFQQLVAEIMSYRVQWLSQYKIDSEEYKTAEAEVSRAVNHGSELQAQGTTQIVITPEESARQPFTHFRAIYDRFMPYLRTSSPAGTPGSAPGSQPPRPNGAAVEPPPIPAPSASAAAGGTNLPVNSQMQQQQPQLPQPMPTGGSFPASNYVSNGFAEQTSTTAGSRPTASNSQTPAVTGLGPLASSSAGPGTVMHLSTPTAKRPPSDDGTEGLGNEAKRMRST